MPFTYFLRFSCLLILLSAAWPAAHAQAPAVAPTAAATAAPKRQLAAVRITEALKIDGLLDEAAWREAPVATDFIQQRPNPGPHEKHATEARVLYDLDYLTLRQGSGRKSGGLWK